MQPKVYGIEHVPDDGSLLVGNHTLYGFLPVGVAEAVDCAVECDPNARQSSVAELRDQLRAADRPAGRLLRREAA